MRPITIKGSISPYKKIRVLAINQEKGSIKVFIGLADAAEYFKVSLMKVSRAIKNNTPLELGGFQYRFEKDKS